MINLLVRIWYGPSSKIFYRFFKELIRFPLAFWNGSFVMFMYCYFLYVTSLINILFYLIGLMRQTFFHDIILFYFDVCSYDVEEGKITVIRLLIHVTKVAILWLYQLSLLWQISNSTLLIIFSSSFDRLLYSTNHSMSLLTSIFL